MSKYAFIYELHINDHKYYVHKHILERCQIFVDMLEINQTNIFQYDIHNLNIDFDIILTILYEDKLVEYTPNECITIIILLDYFCYNNKDLIKSLVRTLKPIITNFDQIIKLDIDDAHKGILINHFIKKIYDYHKSKYSLDDVLKFLNYSYLMNNKLIDKIIHRIALKVNSIDIINKMDMIPLHKNMLLKNYLAIYTTENKIIIRLRYNSIEQEIQPNYKKRDDPPDSQYMILGIDCCKRLQTYMNPETHQGVCIDCSDIVKFLNDVNVKFNGYKLLLEHKKFSLYIDKDFIGASSEKINIHELLETYALSQIK